MSDEMDKFVEQVRSRSDIVSTVSKYVQLKSRGGQYWGCCPFHNERTASFTVNPEKGFFYCFGCHAGGNVFNFISKMEHITYFEAIKLQAQRLGIPLLNAKRQRSPDEIKREQREKALINVNTLAQTYFHNCLTITPYGESGRQYLINRGITDEIIKSFNIGFAPNAWDALSKAFVKRGIPPEDLIEAGLSTRRKSGGIYDRFRNRVMIPICDMLGHVVAFGGRIIDSPKSDDTQKKISIMIRRKMQTTMIKRIRNLRHRNI